MKCKKILAILLAVGMMGMMAACGGASGSSSSVASEVPSSAAEPASTKSEDSTTTSGNDVTIGLLVYNDKNEFIQKLISGAQEKCDEFGYKLVTYSADKDSAKEITNMEDVISLSPDVILYNPVDSDAAEATIALANAANIPVITVDRVANGGAVISHVASDNVYGGELAGNYMVELLGSEGGQVVEIQGQAGTSAMRERGEGFNNIIAQHSEIQVVVTQIGNWDKAQGMAIMENALQAYPDIKAVFAHNDTMALGAMEAAQAAGKNDIKIIGFDADDDAVIAVKEGTMAATIEQLPTLMGSRGVELANMYLNKEAVPKAEAVEVALLKTEK